MKRRLRAISLALGLGAALTAGIALGQQPPPPQPQPVPPTRLQASPGGQPGQPLPIQRIDPSQLPPSLRQPGGPFGPGGRPGLPPGLPGQPGANPHGGKALPRRFRPAPPPEPEESGGGHEEEEACPGHGPTDPPPPPNWWRGILMVNNDLAQSSNPLFQLLFRYENKENPCDEKNQPPPFLATVLNFGILAFILYRFGRKPLAEALVKRKQAIMAEIDTATELLENAEGRLHDLEGKMDRMGETLADLRAELAQSAEEEKKHVLAEAEERRIRMIRDAEFRIEQELKGARAQLLQEAVEGAVAAAEQILTQRVGQGDLDRLADDYLSSVGTAISAAAPKAQTQGARS